MSLTLNPLRAYTEYRKAREEEKLLGVPRDGEASEQDAATLYRILSQQRRAFLALMLHACFGVAVCGGSAVLIQKRREEVAARHVPFALPEAFSGPRPPLPSHINEEEMRDLLRKADVNETEIELRLKAAAFSERNGALLLDDDRSWRVVLKGAINRLEEEAIEGRYAQGLYDFYRRYGRPALYGPPDIHGTVLNFSPDKKGHHFGYDRLSSGFGPFYESSQTHQWFEEQEMAYYDPATETLYIAPFIHFKKMAVDKDPELFIYVSDLWFALHDAMTHQKTGKVDFIDSRMGDLSFSERGKALLGAAFHPESVVKELMYFASVITREMLKTGLAKTHDSSEKVKLMKRMAYRIAREILVTEARLTEQVKRELIRIVENPYLIK